MLKTIDRADTPNHKGPAAHNLSPRKRDRYKANRAAKSAENKKVQESASTHALVLGGGAPNMALMAGALAALDERNVVFDVVSTSGAGSLAGLLWLAPKGKSPREALRGIVESSVSDAIYRFFPVNYKVFNKPGTMADLWRRSLALNPWAEWMAQQYHGSINAQNDRSDPIAQTIAVTIDWLRFVWATLCPSDLNLASRGLCAPPPFVEDIVDFGRIKDIKPYFYVNAYNVSRARIDDFEKTHIDVDHIRAAFAFPFIYSPYELNGDFYYEGAVRDCLNFKDLVEKHTGLKTIVVFDVLGTDALIRLPRHLYDAWVLSIVIPLVKTAEDNLEAFAEKYNNGWSRSDPKRPAKADLLKVEFDIPDKYLADVLDWSISNAQRLFRIGFDSGHRFIDQHADKLKFSGRALVSV